MVKRIVKLTNDPLSLKISPETISVPIDKIIAQKNYKHDEFFEKKYVSYLLGESIIYETRTSIDKIIPGFYTRVEGDWKHIKNICQKSSIKRLMADIRNGYRPPLHLYHNLNKECEYPFVCSDDEVIYYAYKELNISSLPVIILSSNKGLEESAFAYRIFSANKEYINCLLSAETISKNSSYSLLGETLPESINDGLEKLISYLNIAIEKLKLFHLNKKSGLHYHHIIHSALIRARELIESINLLTKNNFYIQSVCLIRNLYELTLNFYMIWLSPEKMARLFQITCTPSSSDWEKACNKLAEEQIRNGVKVDVVSKIKKSRLYEYNLVNKVIEKARIHPLGEGFYNNIYSFLSEIAHDGFSVTARYKNTLELGNDQVYNEDIIKKMLRLADLCIANIYFPAIYDIGICHKD